MSESQRGLDRRTLLKLMGAAGTSVTGARMGATLFGPAAVGASGGVGTAPAAQEAAPAGIDPFEVRVAGAELEDLSRRLQSPRWPPDSPGEPWSYGTDRAYLEELIAYWRDEYDWRAHEAALNAFDHYTTTIDGQLLHSSASADAARPRWRWSCRTAGPAPSGRCSRRSWRWPTRRPTAAMRPTRSTSSCRRFPASVSPASRPRGPTSCGLPSCGSR